MNKKMSHLTWTALTLTGGLLCASAASAMSFTTPDHPWQVRTTANGFIFDTSDNAGLKIENTADFAFDVTYFFTPNIAVDVLATYLSTQISVKNGGPDNVGAVDLLPPIFTLQYHFTQLESQGLEPYVGIGFNYNHFGNDSGLLAGVGHVDDSFGGVAEIGTDIPTPFKGLYLNGNFKYLYTKPDVKAKGDGTIDKLKINAFIIGAGVGYRF